MSTLYKLSIVLLFVLEGLSCHSQSVSGNIGGHNYVDIGLPSGIKWATCNMGASKPSDSGDYYAWGEVETKGGYSWTTYLFCKEEDGRLNKYCHTEELGVVDKKSVLELDDDASTSKWGKKWRMPRKEEFQELIDNCIWEWTNDFEGSGKSGCVGTSKRNENKIFFPASGQRYEAKYAFAQMPGFSIPNPQNGIEFEGEFGGYWSSSLCLERSKGAFIMNVSSYAMELDIAQRCIGHSVRAVCE